MVSAYFNKAFPRYDYRGEFSSEHVKFREYAFAHFNHSNLNATERANYIVTFEEFIHFSLFGEPDNLHWIEILHLCDPCNIDFDYIMRIETFKRDSGILMKKLYPKAGPIPGINVEKIVNNKYGPNWVEPKTLDIFAQLPEETLRKIYQKYALDLEFFGYSFDSKTYRTDCRLNDKNCC